MGNMSYCRHENTFIDLKDCWEQWNDEPTSESEKKYRRLLLELCKEIAEEGLA
jgi:hypothetical protein